MNVHILKTILVDELGAEQEGDTYSLSAASKVSIMVHFGDNIVPVSKVREVRVTDDWINLVGEAEQFFVDPDCDFFVKSDDPRKRAEARPGFH